MPGFAAANRMETDLDMGGNAIAGAGEIEASSLAVENGIEAGGDLTVSGDLLVGRAVKVAGAVEAAGEIAAGDRADIRAAVTGAAMTVSGAMRAETVDATGAVSAGSIGAVGAVTAGSARLGGLDAATVTARTVTAGTVSASSVDAARVRADTRLDADNGRVLRVSPSDAARGAGDETADPIEKDVGYETRPLPPRRTRHCAGRGHGDLVPGPCRSRRGLERGAGRRRHGTAARGRSGS